MSSSIVDGREESDVHQDEASNTDKVSGQGGMPDCLQAAGGQANVDDDMSLASDRNVDIFA